MKKKIKLSKLKNIYLNSSIFSIALFELVIGLRNLNPKRDDYLSFQDGTAEIAWEFFRHTSLSQWPIYLNNNYGLENAEGISFDGSLILFSLIFKPFNFILSDRFQFIGLSILIAFFLNYLLSYKIFKNFNFTYLNSSFAALILSTSPIILDRIISNTHYWLIHFWIIMISLLFYFKKYLNPFIWGLISSISIMIHLYWTVFVILIFAVTAYKQSRKLNYAKFFQILLIFTTLNSISLWILGYLNSPTVSEADGYGLYRTSLTSLFDPENWSRLLPNIPSFNYLDDYEGFAYLGVSSILVLIVLFITKTIKTKINNIDFDFFSLFVIAYLLFLFSLSNKISILNFELFSFPLPHFLDFIANTFRSTGRFSWLLVILIFIYLLVKLSNYYDQKFLSFILVSILIVHLFDIYPELTSQKNSKYVAKFETVLKNKIWHSVSECYQNLRFFPPTSSVNNLYDFAKFASSKKMGINSGRFGRVNENFIMQNTIDYQNKILEGAYNADSAYVFTGSRFYPVDLFNFYKDVALRTIPNDAAWQVIDGFFTVLPKIEKCQGFPLNKVNIGPPKDKLYFGQDLQFVQNGDYSKFNLYSFADFQKWGIQTSENLGRIILNIDKKFKFENIKISAKSSNFQNKTNQGYTLKVNNVELGKCIFTVDLFEDCIFKYKATANILVIDIYPLSDPVQLKNLILN